jgi:hypothetical protein
VSASSVGFRVSTAARSTLTPRRKSHMAFSTARCTPVMPSGGATAAATPPAMARTYAKVSPSPDRPTRAGSTLPCLLLLGSALPFDSQCRNKRRGRPAQGALPTVTASFSSCLRHRRRFSLSIRTIVATCGAGTAGSLLPGVSPCETVFSSVLACPGER